MSPSSARALGDEPDRLVGLQLTHSGRWSRPDGAPQPQVAYAHPFLDERVGPVVVLTDAQLDDLVGDFVAAAVVAQRAGFDFVDVKHCHGYLLHELLQRVHAARSLRRRPRRPDAVPRAGRGRASGAMRPGLEVAVRLERVRPRTASRRRAGSRRCTRTRSVATAPERASTSPSRTRSSTGAPRSVSGSCASPPAARTTARTRNGPAYFPPSDGYDPPYDPLIDVARLIAVTGELDARPSGPRRRRQRLLVSAGVAAERRAGGGCARARARRRTRPARAVVPDARGRRARRAPARPGAPVPNVLRLHDGAPPRSRLGLLSARRVLQGEPRTARARPDQARLMRTITGMAAVLLPFDDAGAIDWPAFDAHVARTRAAGLVPAVNMDTGFGAALDPAGRRRVLDRAGPGCVCGVYVDDAPGATARSRWVPPRDHRGGTVGRDADRVPVVGSARRPRGRSARRVRRASRATRIAFSRSSSAPCSFRTGASSRSRRSNSCSRYRSASGRSTRRSTAQLEWERLALRDRMRPDFMVLTGNDRAIDMVVHGSDYLLGLATFAPDWFAARDRAWAAGDRAGLLGTQRLVAVPRPVRVPGPGPCLSTFRGPVPAASWLALVVAHTSGVADSARERCRRPRRDHRTGPDRLRRVSHAATQPGAATTATTPDPDVVAGRQARHLRALDAGVGARRSRRSTWRSASSCSRAGATRSRGRRTPSGTRTRCASPTARWRRHHRDGVRRSPVRRVRGRLGSRARRSGIPTRGRRASPRPARATSCSSPSTTTGTASGRPTSPNPHRSGWALPPRRRRRARRSRARRRACASASTTRAVSTGRSTTGRWARWPTCSPRSRAATIPAYADAQVRELIARYRPSVLWNDIAWPAEGKHLWPLFAHYYEQVPDGVVNDRWMPWNPLLGATHLAPVQRVIDAGARRQAQRDAGIVPPKPPHFDVRTPEYAVFPDVQRTPWECVRGMDHSFGYNAQSRPERLHRARRAALVVRRHRRQGRQPAPERRATRGRRADPGRAADSARLARGVDRTARGCRARDPAVGHERHDDARWPRSPLHRARRHRCSRSCARPRGTATLPDVRSTPTTTVSTIGGSPLAWHDTDHGLVVEGLAESAPGEPVVLRLEGVDAR